VSWIARHGNLSRLVALAVAMALLPLVFASNYVLTVLIFIGLFAILAVGLSLLLGYTGQVSLGHAAFYGLGAYGSAILTTTYGWSVLPAAAAAAVVTAGIAAAIGAPILRLVGNYLAMATLALGLIVFVIFNEMFWLTGGPSGIRGVPRLEVFGWVARQELHYYYVVWAVVLVVIALSLNLVNSRVGRAMRAIHSSQIAAEMVGVPVTRLKVQVFALTALFASLAGSLYAHYITFVNPAPFGVLTSIVIVVMAVVGGLASVWGAIAGAAMITLLGEALRVHLPRFLPGPVSEQEIIIFGLLLVLVMIFAPQGLVPGSAAALSRIRMSGWLARRRVSPATVAAGDPPPAGPTGSQEVDRS
jgi:branched-chain amino acid transport system permease protein